MKITSIAVILLISSNGLAQELKKIKKSDASYQEIYNIDKKTKSKYGDYIKIAVNTNDTLVIGHFDNDKKVKTWKYFGKNKKIYCEYDYDKGTVNYLENENVKSDSFHIKSGNSFILSPVDSPPIYIGFENEVKSIIQNNIKPTSIIFRNEISGISMASFVVNKAGKIQDVTIETSVHSSFEPEIKKTINLIEGKWIPAKVTGEPIESKIYVLFDIKLTNDPSKKTTSIYKEKPYLLVVDITYYGVIREVRSY